MVNATLKDNDTLHSGLRGGGFFIMSPGIVFLNKRIQR